MRSRISSGISVRATGRFGSRSSLCSDMDASFVLPECAGEVSTARASTAATSPALAGPVKQCLRSDVSSSVSEDILSAPRSERSKATAWVRRRRDQQSTIALRGEGAEPRATLGSRKPACVAQDCAERRSSNQRGRATGERGRTDRPTSRRLDSTPLQLSRTHLLRYWPDRNDNYTRFSVSSKQANARKGKHGYKSFKGVVHNSISNDPSAVRLVHLISSSSLARRKSTTCVPCRKTSKAATCG